MTSTFSETKKILEAISEKTDMMYNAILVDQFDVFEHNLDLRGRLIEAYEQQKSVLSPAELESVGGSDLFKELSEMDEKIHQELLRYQEKLKSEFDEMQLQKNTLKTNVKKTNQYQQMTESSISGHRFDKQK